ncbi:hypothetical protein GGS24DRAFT_437951 [Hypoxylon argillaceum]|nr:hypothetical protein GGS24DRAFT_437951 [Hypoxylon argillaceum]
MSLLSSKMLKESFAAVLMNTKTSPRYSTNVPKCRSVSYLTRENQFPSAPLYSVGEIVYVQSSGGVVSGPYEIVSISAEKYYTIKRIDNGQLHSGAVAESTLCIPV